MTFMPSGELHQQIKDLNGVLSFLSRPTIQQCCNFIFKWQDDYGMIRNAEYNIREFLFENNKPWCWKNHQLKSGWHEIYFILHELVGKNQHIPLFTSAKDVHNYINVLKE